MYTHTTTLNGYQADNYLECGYIERHVWLNPSMKRVENNRKGGYNVYYILNGQFVPDSQTQKLEEIFGFDYRKDFWK